MSRQKATPPAREKIITLYVSGHLIQGKKCRQLRKRVKRLLRNGHRKILLDLTNCSRIDTSGMVAIFAAFAATSDRRGKLKLMNLKKKVYDTLEIEKFLKIFGAYDPKTKALSGLKKKQSAR